MWHSDSNTQGQGDPSLHPCPSLRLLTQYDLDVIKKRICNSFYITLDRWTHTHKQCSIKIWGRFFRKCSLTLNEHVTLISINIEINIDCPCKYVLIYDWPSMCPHASLLPNNKLVNSEWYYLMGWFLKTQCERNLTL